MSPRGSSSLGRFRELPAALCPSSLLFLDALGPGFSFAAEPRLVLPNRVASWNRNSTGTVLRFNVEWWKEGPPTVLPVCLSIAPPCCFRCILIIIKFKGDDGHVNQLVIRMQAHN